jgi:RNA polymerase sigma factor (TIGR02999 family)
MAEINEPSPEPSLTPSQPGGDEPQSAEALLPQVYAELRRLAARQLQKERKNHSLSPTGLVHEAFLRLQKPGEQVEWNNRGHFFAAAAQAMRRILVDHARKRKAAKRGGGVQFTMQLDAELAADQTVEPDLLVLDRSLTALEAHDAQLAQLVSLRYFAGLTMAQVAEVLGVSLRTAERNWSYAKAWLQVNMQQQD